MARARKSAHSSAPPLAAQVFAQLSDGRFHSGEDLARALRVSRSAVWKAVGTLKVLGATLEAVRNRGYRLAGSGEPLDARKIRRRLSGGSRARVKALETIWSIDSTNAALLKRASPPPGTSEVLLAEVQSAGRGRRGRTWIAAPGGAICLSLSWTFPAVPEDLGALGLVIGVCVLRALKELNLQGLQLKWPNDLLVQGKKLGGVLIELRAETAGPAFVVIGIGLNVALGEHALQEIAASGIPATDLQRAGLAGAGRNAVAAAVIGQCVAGLLEFEQGSLKPFIGDWRQADALEGKAVNVSGADGVASGMARGIDVHGALLLETRAGVQRFIAGDVTVRPS
jgi:BirA family transcriptional regulator, biotin operon repressor / biotin---[acetyl-CoA-carboxylase] ligase